MKVKIDTEIIGKECFVISRSITSGEITVRQDKITGMLVDKDKKVSVRLSNGAWLSADSVYTENIEAEILKFKKKYETEGAGTSEN